MPVVKVSDLAFGRLQSIDVLGTADQQSDRNFGEHISSRYRLKGTMKASYLARKFPAGRFQVSRRGYRGPWVFELNEERGTRFAFDDAGAFVQDVTYAPFGEMRSTGPAMPATTRYSSDLWNGGEALDRFGLVQLGARLYDPVIGRFLSRDPLFVPRTAATTNPYAFAFNDPINHADPTGADAGDGNGSDGTTCEGDECQGPDGSGWGLGSGYYDDGGYFVYLPPPGYRPRANSPTHTDPVEPKPIVPFNEPTEDSEEDSDVDAGIEFGAFGLDFTGAGYDAAESAGWFAKHGSVFAEVSEIAGKVAGGFEVLGAAASGYGFVKHTDVEHTVDFGLSVGGASAALMGHPVVALVAFGGKLAWGWIVDQYHEDQKEYEAELRRWRFQNLILTGMHIADLYANRELKAEVDGALFRLSDEFVEQGCWLLGGHDSITEERTRVRDAGGGILIDGTPQNSSPIE